MTNDDPHTMSDKIIETSAHPTSSAPASAMENIDSGAGQSSRGQSDGNNGKRKFDGRDSSKRGRANKRRDMGRKEWQRSQPDRRQRNEDAQAKRSAEGKTPTALPSAFPQEEIDAQDRRPKRKVAVFVGYSGTGYKGMQISPDQKTIEGDLFVAFIKAGAISRANADDPKKSSLVRCARTDKGVHAAGNMISLKLIIEDEDIVEKINSHLAPQIRVWGIERTTGSFSCYQTCDSRWYEYLIPSHAFLPPHPSSYIATMLEKAATEVGDRDAYLARQEEVQGFWAGVEENDIQPIVNGLDKDVRALLEKALHEDTTDEPATDVTGGVSYPEQAADIGGGVKVAPSTGSEGLTGKTEEAAIIIKEPALERPSSTKDEMQVGAEDTPATANGTGDSPETALPPDSITAEQAVPTAPDGQPELSPEKREQLQAAIKKLKAAYEEAKRAYRIPASRVKRIQDALDQYLGTQRFHNYTVQKTFRDPSSKRTIKSFVVNPTPIVINGTEWLSLKVHGQSFMMHQIRKMVGMVALLVRCGTDLDRMRESYTDTKMSIPKAPGLGLLLERPVFDTYNNQLATKFDREPLDFGKFEEKIEAFKRDEIYTKIFEEEARENTFHQFFNHIDAYKDDHFLWLTSWGLDAMKKGIGKKGAQSEARAKFEEDSDEEGKNGHAEG